MVSNDVINVLADLLHDEDSPVPIRVAAAEGLGFSGFGAGRAALLWAIQKADTDSDVRAAAIRALGQTLQSGKS